MPRHLPYNRKLVARAKELRRNATPAEKKLWNACLKHLDIKVYRQRPIDNFIVDFYIPRAKLVIEVDGASHFTPEGRIYDADRTNVLSGYGLQVMRFTNLDVLNNLEGVSTRILAFIVVRQPPKSP
ncbi:MAG: endonuclease domain-containing protein [Deinococcota bacterium]